MAQKLVVNNTSYTLNGQFTVRIGSTPGNDFQDPVLFTVNPNSQVMVPYGDANDPFLDAMEISAVANGSVVLSDQIVITRSATLDNLFNQNDTLYIALQGQSFVVTSANTWTTSSNA